MPRLLEALPIMLRVKRDEFTHPTGDDSRDALTVGVERRNLSRHGRRNGELPHQHGIQGAKRRGKPWRTTISDPNATRPADLVERDFTAEAPDQLWVCDFTRMRCWDGVLYLAFVIDVYSRRVVGWQLATHMRDTLVIDALRMALGQRRPGADVALVVHSDAGSQYTSYDHVQVLDDHDVLQSIGTVGDALDNAMAESFVDSFKTELIRDRAWPTRTGLEFAIVEYLGWFNHDRLHSALGDIPPAEFEALHAPRLLSEVHSAIKLPKATITDSAHPCPAHFLRTSLGRGHVAHAFLVFACQPFGGCLFHAHAVPPVVGNAAGGSGREGVSHIRGFLGSGTDAAATYARVRRGTTGQRQAKARALQG